MARKVVMSAVVAGVIVSLAACSSQLHRAPVEDRAIGGRASQPFTPPPGTTPSGSAQAPKVDPPPRPAPRGQAPAVASAADTADNAGKPGFYTVKAGDTLLRVALETGQNWRDIQRWNSLDNAHVLQVGEVLRVIPLNQDPGAVVTRAVVPPSGGADSRSADLPSRTSLAATAQPAAAPAAVPVLAPATVAAATTATASTSLPGQGPGTAAAPSGDEDLGWIWPADGSVIAAFDEARTKGMLIGGNVGDPVVAAADGRVVYSGSGLRGYGNLVIIKHNNTYLTAYAHNKTLLVREDQPVKRGQKIAEMGSTDAQRVQLHFEVRKQGKPIDPARVLPPR
ncbi:MAG TPA: peptidoglycan DD-metalloendopeptidase family protein [Burkholderiaceae bacterium]|nr:peptidoglycan DD-metalloendopeptidase family protein [Burkholderiaceae bacterium]